MKLSEFMSAAPKGKVQPGGRPGYTYRWARRLNARMLYRMRKRLPR